MSCSVAMRARYVGFGVILEPVSLVDTIIPCIRCVRYVEVDEKLPGLKAGWIEGDGVREGDTNQTPFSCGFLSYFVRDKE